MITFNYIDIIFIFDNYNINNNNIKYIYFNLLKLLFIAYFMNFDIYFLLLAIKKSNFLFLYSFLKINNNFNLKY